ncbi:MAG: substrate-binding domain-containing protein, partial [Anaerolineae bacterium]|nr:substrate-binding domain-containing protein [Anaerolineae bacterium]
VDGQCGTRITAEHLLAKGHRRIGLITWPEGSRAGEEREQGYRRGLEAAGVSFDEAWLFRGDNSVQSGFHGVNQLLQLPEARRPTAVMCVSDQVAIGALNGAQALGLEVGQDVAITGFDDMPTAEFLQPALTTVRQPIPEVGQQVVDLLLKQLNEEPIEQKGILLKPELIVRRSS